MPLGNATPLISVDALVLDTETTGLDPRSARLIEIGAINLRNGDLERDHDFRLLVRPPDPVPPASTLIHGLDDTALAGAPPFSAVQDEIERRLNRELVIGHSLGFDLTILKNEFARTGRDWVKPRSLCTRLLSEVARPDLPDYSIEGVAAWLGVTPQQRHSALADATTAGRIFLALLPHLRARGIRTVAEAERACQALTHTLEAQHRAGWTAAAALPPPRGRQEHRAGDLYPYRNRVDAVMSHPVVATPDVSVGGALAQMTQARISSLLVRAPSDGPRPETTGIITERDLMRALAARGADAFAIPVGELASRPLHVVAADAFVHRAIARMSRLQIRHLGVTDARGAVCGILSARDLLRLRAREALWLGDEIDQAGTVAALGRAWSSLPGVAAALRTESVPSREIAGLISQELQSVTARAAHLAEQAMSRPPPCLFTVAVLGSAGRGESLLALDQDNAVVFAEDSPEAEEWFAEFGRKLADILHEAGVPYCKGGIMASNPSWRGSLATWRQRVADWITASDPQKLFAVDIFFDLRGVYGESALAETIWQAGCDAAADQPAFAKLLNESAGATEPGLTLFGRIRSQNGRIDLKKTALFGIVKAARVLAIHHHIVERSSFARLEGLRRARVGGDEDLASLIDGLELLLGLIVDQQINDIDHGRTPSNSVDVRRLSARDRERLRDIFHLVGQLDNLTQDLLA